MERYFQFNNYNSFTDWGLIVTEKVVTPPEPKTNYVEIDGRSGSLDLTEALTGEVKYNDRTVEASFWTSDGTRAERERMINEIVTALHGRKIQIIEPDDPEHYFIGRPLVTSYLNILPYAELTIEAVCEPWRYAIEETKRRVEVAGSTVDVAIHNGGTKTIIPTVTVDGSVTISYGGALTKLTSGRYQLLDLKLCHGTNLVTVSGDGAVTFAYREATL